MRRAPRSGSVILACIAVIASGCGASTGLAVPGPSDAHVDAATDVATDVVPDIPVDTAPADPVVQIAAGYQHTCMLHASGAITCAGVLAAETQFADAVQIASGADFSCAVRRDETVWCWGFGRFGELGYEIEPDRTNALPVPGVADAVQVAATSNRACALLRSGGVVCWGWARNDLMRTDLLPRAIDGVSHAVELAVGEGQVCARRDDGRVQCWGEHDGGELGDGSDGDCCDPSPPVFALGIATAASIGCGNGVSCAALRDGSVVCWGHITIVHPPGVMGWSYLVPTPVQGAPFTVALSANGNDICALGADGTVSCMGENLMSDNLGDGTHAGHANPLPVIGVLHARSLSLGDGFACALLDDSTTLCWGGDSYGQLDGADRILHECAEVVDGAYECTEAGAFPDS